MQRTAQRENAFQATMRPNSNSDSSALRGDTRCEDETMLGPAALFLRGIGLSLRRRDFVDKTLAFYLNGP
jgi:hypothetical protein